VTTGGGATISDNNTSVVTIVGTVAEVNAALASVTFSPVANANGAVTLTQTTNDGGNAGSGGGADQTATVAITVNAINDDPINTVPGPQTTSEDTDLVFSAGNGNLLSIADVDAGTGDVTTTLSVTSGTLAVATGGGATITDNNTGAVTIVGTVAEVNAALATVAYSPVANAHGAVTLTQTTNDGGNSGAGGGTDQIATVAITVNAVNDDPVNSVPGAQATNEDTDLVFSNGNGNRLFITDIDAGTGEITITLSVTSGTLAVTTSGGASISDNNTGTVTIVGTVADVNAALATVTFSPAPNANGTVTLTQITNDGGNSGAGGGADQTATVAITVNAVNDDPVNSVPGAQTTNEDTDLVFSTDNGNLLSINDVDAGAGTVTTTLSVTSGTLSVTSGGGSAISDNKTGTVTIVGTIADVNAALASVTFSPAANENGAVTLTQTTNDGGNSGAGGGSDQVATVAITVNAINDDPVNIVPGPQSTDEDTDLVFSNGNGNRLSITDVDAGTGDVTTTLSVTSGTLSVTAGGGATISDNNTGAVTIVGTVSEVNAALASVTFSPLANSSTAVTLTQTTNDGGNSGIGGGSDQVSTVAISFGNINDAPVNSVPGPQATNEDTALTFSAGNGNGLSIVDVDAGGADVTTTLSVTSGTLAVATTGTATISDNMSGTVTIVGSVAEVNAALASVTFTPAMNSTGAVTLTQTTNDGGNSGTGGALEDSDTVAITINPVNDDPVNSVPAAQSTNEDTDLVFSAGTGNLLSIADVDAGTGDVTTTLSVTSGTLAVTTGGGAAISDNNTGTVTIVGTVADVNAALATVTFSPEVNANGAVTLTQTTNDGGSSGTGGGTDQVATVAIAVNPVNDDPVNNVPAAQAMNEDTNLDFSAGNGNLLSVTDLDAGTGNVTTTLSVTSGSLSVTTGGGATISNNTTSEVTIVGTVADVNAALASVTFSPVADANGAVTLTQTTNDNGNSGSGGGTDQTATVAITINPVNDAPAITNLAGDIAQILAGGSANLVDTGANAIVSDLDGATDFNGGFVTFDITAGTDNGTFSFDGVDVTSGGDGTIAADETIRVGGTVIGTVSADAGRDGQAGNLLRIDFDAGNATPVSLSTLVRSLRYVVPDGFGDRTLTTTLNDGAGTAGGGTDETVVVSTIRVPVAPQVQSIERQDPASAETNADSVTFRVTFDSNVSNVDASDFALSGTLAATSSVTGVTRISATVYDVAVDVPDDGNGSINLDISAAPSVENGAGINIRASAPSLGADETYTIDNTAPAVPLADLAAFSDRGASDTDDITNDTTPTITGTVDANTTVTILSSIDGQVGQDSAATYNGAGIITSALSDGVHILTILSTDVAGNSSMAQLTVTIDTIAPTATAIGSPIAPADGAVITFSEAITFNDGAAAFMTTLNAGAVVQDNFVATNANTSLSGGNLLTFARPTVLALGSTFSAQIGAGMVTDIAGNTNAALNDVTTLVFETFGIPAVPAGLDLIAPSDTGQSDTDDITADATPTITGTADANATINLTSSLDGLVGTIQADANGNWSITTRALRDGVHDFTATATNPAAVSPASAILSVTVDTTIRTPATPDLTDASDTGASSVDNVTFDKTPTLTGTAEPGATVTLTSSISGRVGTAIASAAGTWTMTTGTLPEGDHVFTVGMIDIAGNVSPQSPGLTVTIATERTESPGTVAAPDDGQSSTGTDGSEIAGLGTSDVGPGGPSGNGLPESNFDSSGPAPGSGFTGQTNQEGGLPPAGRAPRGADPIITAGLGEQQPLSGDVLSESDLPGSITLDPASDSGFSNSDNRTNVNRPVFNGEAPANSTVTITSSPGGVIGTATVDETGKWTFKVPASLADGIHELIATPSDEDGNKGVPSLPLLATIDTIAPETPAPPALDGEIDQLRSDESRTFRGKAEPGARIVLTSDRDGIVGDVIADENGNWQIVTDALSEDSHALTVTATDEAGNVSAPSRALNIVVRGADDTALDFDREDPIRIDVAQGDGSVAYDAVDMTALLKGFTRDIEGFEQAQMENTQPSQAVGFTRQLQKADAERMFA